MQCITDETGHLLQELSYDAWGNRRDADSWTVYTTLPAGILLARGFTGHEHIDLFDLINMDGRIYDPVVGRFLSPDPMIQDPENLQSLNRYSYCLNNPLSLTDPSGYSWLSDNWRSLVAAAVGISVSILTAGTTGGFWYAVLAGTTGGFAGGFTGALLSGADLGQAFKAGAIGALIGSISAGVANGVGSLEFDDDALVGKMLAHGITQGGLSELSGDKFEHGFFSAALSAGLAGTITEKDGTLRVGRVEAVVASAVVGGTASALGGGKFANGAITGAYVMMFNALMHEKGGPQKGNNAQNEKGSTGVGFIGSAGIGLIKKGIQISVGVFWGGPGVGQIFFSVGYPDLNSPLPAYFDFSASIQAMYGISSENQIDLSGEGKSYGIGYGSVAGGMSTDNANKTFIFQGGVSTGIKYSGGGVNTTTYTYKFPSFFPLMFTAIGGKY
jgi:RHS repeat-associated protein